MPRRQRPHPDRNEDRARRQRACATRSSNLVEAVTIVLPSKPPPEPFAQARSSSPPADSPFRRWEPRGLGYEIAAQFGLHIVPCRPRWSRCVFDPEEHGALVRPLRPLDRGHRDRLTERSAPCEFREKMLITHRGLSGPAILQASSYWQPGQTHRARSRARRSTSDRAALCARTRVAIHAAVALPSAPRGPRDSPSDGSRCIPPQAGPTPRSNSSSADLHAWSITPGRNRRLRQGRGHRRRRRHRRTRRKDDGEPQGPGPLLHRRGRRRHRLARRLQLPVGLGLGRKRRTFR